MGRPRKNPIVTRDPQPINRDPVIEVSKEEDNGKRPYHFWNYIPEGAPTVCPKCQHNLRNFENTPPYIDVVNKKIMTKKICSKCSNKVGTMRPMTLSEIERHCTHVDAIAEYEKTKL